jgi:hypothetical protein
MLETHEVIFRGEGLRVVLKLAELTEAATQDGVLVLRTRDSERLELELGDAATKWLKKIKNPPSRLDKLGVKTGMKVAVIGVPRPCPRHRAPRARRHPGAQLQGRRRGALRGRRPGPRSTSSPRCVTPSSPTAPSGSSAERVAAP